MSKPIRHDVRVLLPDEVYSALQAESKRTRQAAADLAREAIETWLESRRRGALHEAIAAYAAAYAGSNDDLDSEPEAAALHSWRGETAPDAADDSR